ncbi:clathrin light chain [Ixodes scapularis]
MADFDNFEANFDGPPAAEEDPAAEFLAREQDVLAGLEDDNDNFGVNVAEPLADGPTNDIAAEFGEIQMNGPSEMLANNVNDTSPRPTPVREEPEKIKKWREEQAKMLEIKDVEEEKKKDELRAAAKKELDEWYARYQELIEKSKQANRRVRDSRPPSAGMRRKSGCANGTRPMRRAGSGRRLPSCATSTPSRLATARTRLACAPSSCS